MSEIDGKREALRLMWAFNQYFTSANEVDVPERITVKRDEWRALRDALVTPLYTTPPASQEPYAETWFAALDTLDQVHGRQWRTRCETLHDSLIATLKASHSQAQQPSGGEVVAWTESKPTKPGIYGWRGSPASYDMVHVHSRPTEHSSGGQLNGSCLSGKGFYHGCAITSWGGEWVGPLDTLTIATPKPEPMTEENFQNRVAPWMQACFGPTISADRTERGGKDRHEHHPTATPPAARR